MDCAPLEPLVIPPSATAARRLAEMAALADIVPVYESRVAAINNSTAQWDAKS